MAVSGCAGTCWAVFLGRGGEGFSGSRTHPGVKHARNVERTGGTALHDPCDDAPAGCVQVGSVHVHLVLSTCWCVNCCHSSAHSKLNEYYRTTCPHVVCMYVGVKPWREFRSLLLWSVRCQHPLNENIPAQSLSPLVYFKQAAEMPPAADNVLHGSCSGICRWSGCRARMYM